jgi:CRP/FNR family transcriptional regulator
MTPTQESICKLCSHRNTSVFSGLNDDDLDAFCGLKLVHHYKKDQRVFYEGEPNLGISILCSGKIKLSRSSNFGRRQILGIVDPCGFLEEKDLFLSERHSVSAEAMEDSVVCFIKKESFLEFLKLNPEVALKLIEQLSRELEQAEERIEALAALDVRKRVAGLLLKLAARYGRATPDGRLIEVALTREEIAEMIGTTQETVIRVLGGFRKERLIGNSKRHLLLLNDERLKKIAG